MSTGATGTASLQDDGLGFRPAPARAQTSQQAGDDGLGFRSVQSAGPDDLGFRAATPAAAPTAQAQPSATPTPAAKPTARPLAAPTPQEPTIGPAPAPTLTQRVRSTVANSAIGHAVSESMPKLADFLGIQPTETVYNPEEAEHAHEVIAPGAAFDKPGVAKGAAEFAGGLTTPENVIVAAGSAGLGQLSSLLGESARSVVPKLISLGFSAQMAQQAAQQWPALKQAIAEHRYDDAKQIATEAGLGLLFSAAAFKHAGTEEIPTFGTTLDRTQASAPEAVVAGDTAPDYLARVRQRIADRIAETTDQERAEAQRQARINAPVNLPKLPATTEPPPILERPAPQTPMEELSAQADQVRQGREFRQQLTQEIGDEIEKRLRDAGLLEPPKPGVQVVDRRAVKPEDVEPYQRPRTFIGSESIPPSVVPRGANLSSLLESERPSKLSADDAQLGFRPAEAQRMLPPASPDTLARIDQEQQRYDAALARARAYGQPKPIEIIQPASAKDITGDSRRIANLAIGRFNHPVEKQYARDLWSSMIGQGRAPVPPSGMTRVRADTIRNGFARISRGEIGNRVSDPQTAYAPDVLDEARAMMAHTNDFLSQQERPGRYRVGEGEMGDVSRPEDRFAFYSVKSLRDQFPWFANLKEAPGDLARAVERSSGPTYNRLLAAAADHIVSTRAETQRMARSVEPDLENLAEQVRTIDPDLADFLADAANGKLSTWTETGQQQLDTIERRISDAHAAIEFGRAVEDLATAERSAGESTSAPGEEEAPAAPGEESAGTREAAPTPGGEVAPTGTKQTLGPEASRLEEQIRDNPNVSAEERRQMTDALGRAKNDESGFATLDLIRDVLSGRLPKDAWQKFVAQPLIEKGLRIGDKYAAVREEDPEVAEGLHLLDNAPAYFRAKAGQLIGNVIGKLSREQERLFTLLADETARENLEKNHPAEYRRAMDDPAIQEALRRYRPIEKQLTAQRQRLGANVLDQGYLRRVYDQHVAGIGKAEAPGSGEHATTAFDRVIQPQKIANLGREATAEYHYQHGLHELGPAFGTKFIATNLRGLEDRIARDFIAKATEIKPGETEPRSIAYNGRTYFRPDIAREMRDAGDRSAKAYGRYDPTAGVKYPTKGASRFLGPEEIVRALNDYGAGRDDQPGAIRRFLQEQVIGFGFGIPHVANILRRVTQSAPLGAANPEAWVRAWRVAFGSELRARGIDGLDDPTFDKLFQHGAISAGEMADLKKYWGGNLNPANWARTLAGVGHKIIFEPGSFGGLGGVDQRARLYIADLVRSQNPALSDERIAQAVNTQLGDYNSRNWTDRQKTLAKFMLFPGWDTSSIRWVIEHPIRTTVPPALLIWTANQVLHHYGKNRAEDANDFSNIHWGDRSIGVTLLRESMARNLARPLSNYVQARLRGENETRAAGEAARGITQGAGGLVGTVRPDLTAAIDLAMNRASPFGGQELATPEDYETPGRILPNRALEKQAALVVRHAIPALDRLVGSDQAIDFKSFAGSNLGLPNYQSGAEENLKRNVAEASDVAAQVKKLAKTNRDQARQFVAQPDNAAYVVFHADLERMAAALKRIDAARDEVNSAKNLTAAEKSQRLAQIAKARENLLRSADGLDALLFRRAHQRPTAPVLKNRPSTTIYSER